MRSVLLAAALAVCFMSVHADVPLRLKIGQMIMVGFTGQTMDDTVRADLQRHNLGGVVLLGTNCGSPLQLKSLTAAVRAAARTPPLIAIDQEGGLVARLSQRNGYAATQSALTLGTLWSSLDSTAAQASLMASWLAGAGITTNFAPVADVNVNPLSPAIGYYGRSFSSLPRTVAAHAHRFIGAFHERQIMTCLKHFPGHGSAGTDSHLTLPDITATWADSELVPYRDLLDAGSVDMVMVGHLYNARIDSIYPSSLSRNTIAGLLRDSLHYRGVVITDDFFNMKAITGNFGFAQSAVLAVNAGVDILLYVNDFRNGRSLCGQLVDTLEARVLDGTIAPARIDEAYSRIQTLKAAFLAAAGTGPAARAFGLPETLSLISYPNPFNPATTLAFRLPAPMRISIAVYDILGRHVETIAEGLAPAGDHRVVWNASHHASGIYVCRLLAFSDAGAGGRSLVATQKLVLTR